MYAELLLVALLGFRVPNSRTLFSSLQRPV
jgi:hypothetical protein